MNFSHGQPYSSKKSSSNNNKTNEIAENDIMPFTNTNAKTTVIK